MDTTYIETGMYEEIWNELKQYGRNYNGKINLTGKNSDLDKGGMLLIDNIAPASPTYENKIYINLCFYASICGNDEWSDEQWDVATEIICGSNYPGEWDGDYWIFWINTSIPVDIIKAFNDKMGEYNIKKAAKIIINEVWKNKEWKQFSKEMSELIDYLDKV